MFYLLYGHLQTTWAYYISAVMASAQAAVIWAVSIAIFSGLVANLVMVRAGAAAGRLARCMHVHVCRWHATGWIRGAWSGAGVNAALRSLLRALPPPIPPSSPPPSPQVQFVQYGPAWLALVLQLLPSFGLYRGLWELSQYAFLADANGGTGGALLQRRGCLAS